VEALQKRICAWHIQRFPDAQMEHVALKICEEVGEVARAINGRAEKNSATGGGCTEEEIADVFISALVLLGRWFPEVNIELEIYRKLVILETKGAHKASRL
jgi:NTP pyrophosphatase (non-canonical NTP hydrolase)